MPIFAGNPSAPLPQSLSPQFPPYELLMRMFGNAQQRAPWAVQPGFQQIPHQYPQVPGAQGGLAQPVADIYKFGRGLLGTEGVRPQQGGAGGKGLLGSKWRDPQFIQQYEVQQGLPPGSIKMPTARLTNISPTATKPVEISPELMAKRLQQSGPTPAQMARPVRMTPEISAKLAEARANRARTRVELEKSSSDMLAQRPFKNMSHDLWGRMSAADRSAWLRDANWKSWPVEQQRTFIERFMPKGIGP